MHLTTRAGHLPKALAAFGFLLAIGLTGCSSGGTSNNVASLGGSTSSPVAQAGGTGTGQGTSEHDALVKYAQCMRAHGINMADPPVNGALSAPPAGTVADQQKETAARTACASQLPNGGNPTAADRDRMLKFAQCMRTHGINMPDPTGNQGISIDMSDPKTKAALTACSAMPSGSVSSGG